MSNVFLAAEWRKLAIFNYVVAPELLLPYVPAGTELDYYDQKCFVSLVGFNFLDTRLKEFAVPFHQDFEEVNLRFYVKFYDGSETKRGVVFIKEIVPKVAITAVANWIYGEHYETMPMRHRWEEKDGGLLVEYQWKKTEWQTIAVHASGESEPLRDGSEEEFITEHFWGYTKLSERVTSAYEVKHPRWDLYPVLTHKIDVDFGKVYGRDFAFLSDMKPHSILLAEGSPIQVMTGERIR
jgi:uncharacterized protein